MLDQIQSHGLLSLTVLVPPVPSTSRTIDNVNRNTTLQSELASVIGKRVGEALRPILKRSRCTKEEETVFMCPLDESLAKCVLGPASEEPTARLELTRGGGESSLGSSLHYSLHSTCYRLT